MNGYSGQITARLVPLLFVFFCSMHAQAGSFEQAANLASKGLGAVVQVNKGSTGRVVLVEEEHVSRAGQIEIAHMLMRLYLNDKLRTIGLEGFTSQKLEPRWTNGLNANDRLRIAARLLGDGELNSAEFMASAFSDLSVIGIDSPTDYKIVPDDQASASTIIYLMVIAESSMKKSDSDTLNNLLQQERLEEARDFAINKDPWTKRTYAGMYGPTRAISTESTIAKIDLIEAEAKKRDVRIPEQIAHDLQSEKQFLQAASRRSDYMVSRIAKLVAESPSSPIAAIIGAAHTDRMIELLKEHDIEVVVVRPKALSKQSNSSNRAEEYQAYQRKLHGKSVDVKGLGGLLDIKRKPPPVSMQPWLEKKASVYQSTLTVVDSVLVKAHAPPYKLKALPFGYNVDPQKITRLGDEILFPVEYNTETGKQTVWVRAAYSRYVTKSSNDPRSIEERIDRLLQEADGGRRSNDGGKPPRNPGKDTEHPGKPGEGSKGKKTEGVKKVADNARQLADGIYASFAKDKATLEKQSILITSKN